jgi:hypothetical protein
MRLPTSPAPHRRRDRPWALMLLWPAYRGTFEPRFRMGTPTSRESAIVSESFLPKRISKGTNRRQVCPVIGWPNFTRMSGAGIESYETSGPGHHRHAARHD